MTDAIDIIRTDETTHGAYRAELEGAPPAELTWKARGVARIATHTFVPGALRGRGIAQQLVEAMVADAPKKDSPMPPMPGGGMGGMDF